MLIHNHRYPDNYLDLIASKLRDRAEWGEVRSARFAKLLQFLLSRYFRGGLNMCRAVVGGLTKVLYKVSLQWGDCCLFTAARPVALKHSNVIFFSVKFGACGIPCVAARCLVLLDPLFCGLANVIRSVLNLRAGPKTGTRSDLSSTSQSDAACLWERTVP